MTRALIYTRVSRDDTGEGRSTERQHEACLKLADLRGWDVVAHESDVSISAYSGAERPAWERALARAEAGSLDIIVAWHIDRMTRSMLELERLILLAEQHGVGIATVTGDIDLTTDVGRMVARILAAVARAEVERKAARQRLANDQRAAEGLPFGTTRAFGYESDGLTIREDEAEAIRQAARDVLDGRSLSAIHRDWRAQGFRPSRMGVREILLNPRLIGQRVHRGEVVGRAAWEPVLDEATFLAVQGVLSDPKRGGGHGRTPVTLLSGLAVCDECGKRLTGLNRKGRKVYACYPSQHVHVDRALADAKVLGVTIARLSQPDALALFVDEHEGPKGDVKVAELLDRMDQLAAAFASGVITIEQMTTGTAQLQVRLREAEEALAGTKKGAALNGLSLGVADVARQVLDLPLEKQRAVVDAVVPTIRVLRNPHRGRRERLEDVLVWSYQGNTESPPALS